MQPTRHPEVPENNQSQHSESPRIFSKMTNRMQETDVTLSRGDSIQQHLSMPLITVTNSIVKRLEPGRGGPGRNGGVNGGRLRWDWGGIVKTFDLISELCFIGSRVSLHLTMPLCESADNELLSEAGADPFCGADREIPKDKANAAIRSREIKIREAG